MKGKIQKGTLVKDDEKFLEGINLITGDKIDYSRNILSESEITQLCINQNLPKLDKFLHIFANGEKIQKWSLFQNMPLYITNLQAAETIFTLIQKNYGEYEEFINIMGEGFCKYLQLCEKQKHLINKKCYDSIYRIMFRTLTNTKFQGSQLLTDWILLLKIYFHFSVSFETPNEKKSKLSQIKQFINGSFLMNTLPQRRKTALQMINSLLQQSQEISVQAHSKVLFFNNDLNPSTRKVICNIIQKILSKQSVPDIWKCVSDYYYKDKSLMIKQKAFQIMSTIHYSPNAENLFNQFDVQDVQCRKIVTKYSSKLLKTFQKQVKSESIYQLKTFAFMNRLLIENLEANLPIVIECFMSLSQYLPQSLLIKQLQLSKIQLESMFTIKDLAILYNLITHIQFRQELKKQIIKGLRYHQFFLMLSPKEISNFLDIFDLSQIEDINIFILMLGKQIDQSRWKNIGIFLDRVLEIKFFQSHLQKMISNILKIYVNCPYFLLQKVHEVILQLLLVDRKNMEMYLKIRQKCLGSKSWMLRRNFIKMYTYFKMNASYEFNRSITPLVYKNIVNEKNILIKMQFTHEFFNAYSYLDPNNQQEKISIKEVISRFAEDKDKELASSAQNTLQIMKQVDKDFQLLSQRMIRNKQLNEREVLIDQVQVQAKKHIKTQKLLPKQIKDLREKPKKGSMVQTKTTAYLKVGNIEKNKILPDLKSLTRSTSTQNKKDLQKLAIPNQSKKSRF